MLDPKNLENGMEQWKKYKLPFRSRHGRMRVQYDFRAEDGELFSCIAPTLKDCRARRDTWLEKRGEAA